MTAGRLRRWWQGPFTRGSGAVRWVGPGIVSVDAIREAVEAARKVLDQTGTPPAEGERSQVRAVIVSDIDMSHREVDFANLEAEGEVALSRSLFKIQESWSSRSCTLAFDRDGTRVATLGGAVAAADALIEVLDHEAERTYPAFRTPQIISLIGAILMIAVWGWAASTVRAPLPLWIFSLTVLSAPLWLLLSWGYKRSRVLASPGRLFLTIDTTPRAEIRVRRFNRGENKRQRWMTALVAGPIGVVLGVLARAIIE